MPVGLLIEAAIAGGIAGERLIEVIKRKNLDALRHIGKEESSWAYLFEYAEQNGDTLVSAIQNGYTYKFITIRGLLNLLKTKYSLIENEDFLMNEFSIELNLKDEQLDFLRSRIPNQWDFTRQENDKYNVHAALSRPTSVV